ncbi:MAG: hypothetical protein IJ734_06305 [Fibrobacter sp.]|nr:hypothetical protein [Fibrobacter sp.]
MLLDTLVSLSLDFGVTLLLDRSSTGAEDDERAELLLDDSSSRGAKLLSSSPQAASAKAMAKSRMPARDCLLIVIFHFPNEEITLS